VANDPVNGIDPSGLADPDVYGGISGPGGPVAAHWGTVTSDTLYPRHYPIPEDDPDPTHGAVVSQWQDFSGCYTECMDTVDPVKGLIIPINILNNAVQSFGDIKTVITVNKNNKLACTVFTRSRIVAEASDEVVIYASQTFGLTRAYPWLRTPAILTSGALMVARDLMIAWTAGTSYGCMGTCAADPNSY
jgi:hypothetical protein